MRTQTSVNETVEMYLKTIAELESDTAPVVIARVAERLGVSAVSANEMVKRLAEQELVSHERYKGVELTEGGRYIAHNVIRRQQLWECFLVDHLKFDWAGAYEMACRLEHATSNVLAEVLSAYLGHPTECPHGNPIPLSDGSIPAVETRPLSGVRLGERGRIHSILPTTTEVYAYMSRHKVLPKREYVVVELSPMAGPITLQIENNRVTIGRAMAELVMVEA